MFPGQDNFRYLYWYIFADVGFTSVLRRLGGGALEGGLPSPGGGRKESGAGVFPSAPVLCCRQRDTHFGSLTLPAFNGYFALVLFDNPIAG